jgi:DDE superfamily endonuclease
MNSERELDAATVALDRFGHSKQNTYAVLAGMTGAGASTIWYRKHGRPSIRQKAITQQYLTPLEERALVNYLLRSDKNGYPLPVKFARTLAHIIAIRRTGVFASRNAYQELEDSIKPPGKNWPKAFHERWPELKAVRLKTIDWERHDHHIYDKVVHWFSVIGPQLADPTIKRENIYNMDETGVLLSLLKELKVLVDASSLKAYRGAGVKRELITVIECISGDFRVLPPLVIWPASTHRANWVTYPTPGWHYGISETGYTDTGINLYWIKNVFNSATKARAAGLPRLLISDGFGTHESPELQRFCYEENIRLARLPSHSSHKLQPCDVGPFGPLKIYYREEVERMYRAGVKMIGKPHFTQLYDRARKCAFTERNIRSGYRKTGLYPYDPSIVLGTIDRPFSVEKEGEVETCCKVHTIISTPTTSQNLALLRQEVHSDLEKGGPLDTPSKLRIYKLANAAEVGFAERSLLLDENELLFEQNNEAERRKSVKSKVIGTAKVLSYEDLVQAELDRDMKEAAGRGSGGKRKSKCATENIPEMRGKRSRSVELEEEANKIRQLEFGNLCTVLRFN